MPPPSSAVSGGRLANLSQDLIRFLGQAFEGGLPQFQGDRVANLSPEIQALLDDFFSEGGGLEQALEATGGIATQDALGRAESLLTPARESATQRTRLASREARNVGGNLLSSSGVESEQRAVADVEGQFGTVLAQLLPALTGLQLQAAGAIPELVGRGVALGEAERGIRQQELDTEFQEFIRTSPAGLLELLAPLLGVNFRRNPNRARGPSGLDFALQGLGSAIGSLGVGVLSDRELKENFSVLDPSEVLDKVANMDVPEWQYKNDPTTRHVGPMAQDFHTAFGLGRDDKTIFYQDMFGVLMICVQELARRLKKLEEKASET